MEKRGTKERILEAALDLFSQRGFDSVSVREIAVAVGIQESSLYNHFQSKRAIFDTLVDLCWQKAEEYYREQRIPFSKEEDLSLFDEEDFSRLSRSVLDTFRYFFEDAYNIRFRRLLVLSQYSDERAAELYRKLYRDYPLEFQQTLFAGLMESGRFRRSDAAAAALEFYGAVFLLLHTCGSWEEAEPRLLAHLQEFVRSHAIPETEKNAGSVTGKERSFS